MVQLKPISADVTVFDEWDQVALIEIKDGEVTILLMHCSEKLKPKFNRNVFEEEIKKWASQLKDQCIIYAMVIQEGEKKSSTWEISKNSYMEMKKHLIIMRDARVKLFELR